MTILLLLTVAGCSSSSDFFRFQNPLSEETEAVSAWIERRNLPDEETPPQESRGNWFGPSERDAPVQSRYFGRGNPESGDSPLPSARQKPERPPEPSPQDSVPIRAVAEAPPSGADGTATRSTGKICYRCNGKGYRLNSLQAGAEFETCETCQGSGRQ